MDIQKSVWVLKIGGNIIDNASALAQFLNDMSVSKQKIVLIHGGGKIATELSKKLGIETKMINGRRITDKETLDVVTMVYAGLINKNIVAQLQKLGKNAIGVCGADANLVLAHKRENTDIDYGYVGDVDVVNAKFLSQLLSESTLPVIAPISHDGKGNLLNTNADTMASETAKALAKEGWDVNLVFGFEKKGLLLDVNDDQSVIHQIRTSKVEELKNNGTIHSGMIPKIDNCVEAIKKGVSKVVIGHASEVKDILQGKQTGTQILS